MDTGIGNFESKAIKAVFLALLVWTLGATTYHAATTEHSPIRGIDFKVYYSAAARLNEGKSLYAEEYRQVDTYLYSPALAIALRPLAQKPFLPALKLWSAVMVIVFLASIAMFAAAARIAWHHAVTLGVILLVGFRFWPTIMSFGLGQVDAVLLALVCGMLLAANRGHLRTAAVCIALAASIKVWMAGLGVYLLIRRAWVAAACCVATFALLMVAGFSIVGWNELPGYLETIRGNTEQQGLVSQSLPGFARLRFAENVHVIPITTNHGIYLAVIGAGLLAVLAALVYLSLLPPARTERDGLLRGGFVVLSLVLLLPLCHTAYFILSLPLIWTLLALPRPEGKKLPVLIGIILIYALFTRVWPVTSPGLKLEGSAWQHLMLSGYFYAGVALWLLTLGEISFAQPRRGRVKNSMTEERGMHVPSTIVTGS